MTDEELIARLRAYREHDERSGWMASFEVDECIAAADRIEALTEQLAAAQHDAKEAEAYAEEVERELRDTQDRANAFATKEYYTEMRAERAEAKLAKAVEALGRIARQPDYRLPSPQGIAQEALAELKGESHD